MSGPILTLNAGSSSIKFALFDAALSPLARGKVEEVRTAPRLEVCDAAGAVLMDRKLPGSSHTEALDELLGWIDARLGFSPLAAAGHRIVHGGEDFTAPVRLTPQVRQALARLSPLAPLHQPHNLAAVAALENLRPGLLQVGCFDTAFHKTIAATRRAFGLPRELQARGIRRYGFHGLSYAFIAERLAQIEPAAAGQRIVVAHLGSGSSLCAMRQGQSVDTSMGLTPLDGLMMGTRCGALDPGAVLYLLRDGGMDASQVEELLYHRSGLLGVSGLSEDMRVLLASPRPEAAQAIELFVFRIVREIGAMAASLGGLDGLVFTGGIGENAPAIRQRVIEALGWLGLCLDQGANQAGATRITTPDSAIAAWVLRTDEESVIARQTAAFPDCAKSSHAPGRSGMLAS